MPVNANAIIFKMFNGETPVRLDAANNKDPLVITRTPGQSTIKVSITVPSGTNYRLEARAYAESNPTDANFVLALAVKSGIVLPPNQHNAISLNLVNPNAPLVSSLTQNNIAVSNAGWGTVLTIKGSNFEDGAKVIYTSSVATSSLPATFIDPQTLTFTIPSDAYSGTIGVFANNKYSTNNPAFKVIKSIVVEPTSTPNIFVNTNQLFVAKAYGDLANSQAIDNPNVTWSVAPNTLGSITSDGLFAANNTIG